MSVWAHDKQHRLIRVIPQRHLEESTVRCLFQENSKPLMEHPRTQQTLFNPNEQVFLVTHKDPMNLHDKKMVLHSRQPRRQEGEMLIFNKINIELLLPLYPMWKEPFERSCNLKEPQQTHVFAYLKRLTNSL